LNFSRTAAAALLAFLFATAPAPPASAGWTVAFEPDLVEYKASDVVTGRLRIGFVADPADTASLPARCLIDEVSFLVIGPDGTQTRMRERKFDRISHPIALYPGEEVLRPVCLAKWDGRFVFAAAGEYDVVAMVSLRDLSRSASESFSSDPVTIDVPCTGTVPDSYVDVLRHLPDICGCFRYGLRDYGVEDLAGVRFGAYDESLYAFMTFQFWHSGVASYVTKARPESGMLVQVGMALCRERSGGAPCRGSWLIEALDAMDWSAATTASEFHELEFGDGDVVF